MTHCDLLPSDTGNCISVEQAHRQNNVRLKNMFTKLGDFDQSLFNIYAQRM